MRTKVGSGGRRRLWIVLGVAAVLVAFGAVRALTDDGGGDGDCNDPEPVVDVETHTEEALDPVNLPGQYNITVEGTITNAAEHPITIGGINVAMATSPDARVYGSGNGAVVEPGESIEFEASGPVELTGSPAAIPDASSANVEWSYEDASDSLC